MSADWSILFTVICLATLALGNLVAIVQTNIKRMLAYSSIAHAGYALIGVVVAGRQGGMAASTGLASVLLYIAIYSFMTLGAFALVGMLRKEGQESDNIEDYAGLAKREPLGAFFMLVFLVSLAGIPPTAGFIGKFYIFMAAVNGGMAWLAVVAVIFAAISAFYYLRIVMVMYMRDPEGSATISVTIRNVSGSIVRPRLRSCRRRAPGAVPQRPMVNGHPCGTVTEITDGHLLHPDSTFPVLMLLWCTDIHHHSDRQHPARWSNRVGVDQDGFA